NTSVLFRNLIRSDGFTVDFLFNRKKKPKEDEIIDHHDLKLEDFLYEEITANYRPAVVDPGRKTVFTAAIGLETERHEIRRCSTKEYYHMTGSTQRKNASCTIKDIEIDIPSWKIGSPEQYEIYTTYILQDLETLFSFYGSGMGETRFRLYQGQQATDEMAKERANLSVIKEKRRRNRKRKKKRSRKKKRKRKRATFGKSCSD
ncbi:hypothetical protein BDF20DRAFT_826467, partial [Mycotypha africana]|uniref:uncharacterized protein n=1 Tax=Mycotypha africana TaxID=64632 RepID=UPI002301BFE6